MSLLPVFLKLAGRHCLLVGAGNVALEKIGTLLPTGLNLRVVAPSVHPDVRSLAAEGKLTLVEREFEATDLDGNFLVFTATDSPSVNQAVYEGCVTRGIPCNSADDVPNCDFYFGSIVHRGPLQVAISTTGQSPALAQRLRQEIDEQLPTDLGQWLDALGQLRRDVIEAYPRTEERKLLLHSLAQRSVCESAACPSRQLALAPLSTPGMPGTVHLVGAGPGDPDLLTVKALRLIQSARLILHDDLVPASILALASPLAEVVNVGKRCGTKNITQAEINALMLWHAQRGLGVVRLKSGDPLIFGRAAEEVEALRAAGISFEIVPGITAAFAAAAALGCSLTDRRGASSVIFSTGHHAQSHQESALLPTKDATRVVYMPGRDLTLLAQHWMADGLPPELPCAVISQAAQPGQQVQCTTLANLGELRKVPAPSVLIAGWSVSDIASAASAAPNRLEVAE